MSVVTSILRGRRGAGLVGLAAATVLVLLAGAAGYGFATGAVHIGRDGLAVRGLFGDAAPAVRPATATPAPMARAVPVGLQIPALGLRSSLIELGLNPDRTVQVPPIERASPAGWYRFSPTPGQRGPAVILGHVTLGNLGRGVFFTLASLHPGNQVQVTRADGTVAVFAVDKVERYTKSAFPTRSVYGDLPYPGLRLITCGGKLDPVRHTYPDNLVVYASLVAARRT